jgi:hypothetical protein
MSLYKSPPGKTSTFLQGRLAVETTITWQSQHLNKKARGPGNRKTTISNFDPLPRSRWQLIVILQRHDRLSHHAVSCRPVACREYLLQVDSAPAETAVRRCKLAAVCSMQSTAPLQGRRTTAAAPTILPIKSHPSHGIMTLPPGGGIVHLRSGLLRGGVRGLNVLDDGGVRTDRYHDFDVLSVSLSLPTIGDDDDLSASVQILTERRAAHKSMLQF